MGFLVGVILVAIVAMIVVVIVDKSMTKTQVQTQGLIERRPSLPREIAQAHAQAEDAARQCLEMCNILGAIDRLSDTDRTVLSVTPGRRDGPSNTELIAEKQWAYQQMLQQCRQIVVEGLQITREPRFVLYRMVVLAAAAVCRACHPGSERTECPALTYLARISGTRERNEPSEPRGRGWSGRSEEPRALPRRGRAPSGPRGTGAPRSLNGQQSPV